MIVSSKNKETREKERHVIILAFSNPDIAQLFLESCSFWLKGFAPCFCFPRNFEYCEWFLRPIAMVSIKKIKLKMSCVLFFLQISIPE